jgi:hypothetical protein
MEEYVEQVQVLTVCLSFVYVRLDIGILRQVQDAATCYLRTFTNLRRL